MNAGPRVQAAYLKARHWPEDLRAALLAVKPATSGTGHKIDSAAWLACCALLESEHETPHQVAERLAMYVKVYTERYGTPPTVTPKRMDAHATDHRT